VEPTALLLPTPDQPVSRLAPAPSHVVGPVWRTWEDGTWYLPDCTLGWEILSWLFRYVRSPGGEYAGEGFLPTDEQARFILWWYAVDPETGRFNYRSGVFRRMKGHGKDPLAAALALAELCGPVAFSHFDKNGNPVGKPRHAAWVQVAAVSQEQTKNTFSLFPVMISAELKADYSLDINKTIIYANDSSCRIEAVTSSPASMEGNRPTFVIRNETQEWVETVGGDDMANVIEGNVKKSPGGVARVLDICNAHVPGRDSIAERAWDAWNAVESGQAVDVGMLYDSIEAPADTPVSEIPSQREDPEGFAAGLELLREGLRVARGDSLWLDIETIVESILDVRNEITESRRKFLNQVNASEDAWIAPWEWDRCQADVTLGQGEMITLGFDGSKSSDHTGLVACRISDGAIFTLKTWNPLHFPGEVIPREQVDAVVHWAFSRYKVVGMRADVREFESYIDQWSTKYQKQLLVKASPNNPIAFDMRGQVKRFALDCEKFLDAVIEQALIHDGDRLLRQHVLNAVRNPTTYDAISIRKVSKDSSKKIDAAVCAVLAWGARQEVLMSNKIKSGRAAVLRG
jgi:phage terminase large subunit-like protein